MGTRIAVMRDGILQQVDTPQDLYDRPANLFVAGFIGSPAMNFFDAVLVDEDGTMYADCKDFRVVYPQRAHRSFQALPRGRRMVDGPAARAHPRSRVYATRHQLALVEANVEITRS